MEFCYSWAVELMELCLKINANNISPSRKPLPCMVEGFCVHAHFLDLTWSPLRALSVKDSIPFCPQLNVLLSSLDLLSSGSNTCRSPDLYRWIINCAVMVSHACSKTIKSPKFTLYLRLYWSLTTMRIILHCPLINPLISHQLIQKTCCPYNGDASLIINRWPRIQGRN